MRGRRVVSGVVVGAALVLAGCGSATPDRDPDPDPDSVDHLVLSSGGDQRDLGVAVVACEDLDDGVVLTSVRANTAFRFVVDGDGGAAVIVYGRDTSWLSAQAAADIANGADEDSFALISVTEDLPVTRSDDTFTLNRVPLVDEAGHSGTLDGTVHCPADREAGALRAEGDLDERFAFSIVICDRTGPDTVFAATIYDTHELSLSLTPEGTATVTLRVDPDKPEPWFNPAKATAADQGGGIEDGYEKLPMTVSERSVTFDGLIVTTADGTRTATLSGTLRCASGHL